jgi:Undecaprenyl-phosphate glucose phosphotransferase
MYRRHGQKLSLVYLAGDLTVTSMAWIGAYQLRFTLWPAPKGIPELDVMLAGLPLILVSAAIAYRVCGLYEIHRLQQLPREIGMLFKASGLMFALGVTAAFYRRDLYESRLALGLFLLLNALGLALARRIVWRTLKHFRRRGLNYGRAIIVGAGRTGRQVLSTIRNHEWTGLDVVGYVDDPPKAEPRDAPRLGTLAELSDVVRSQDVDHVFIALSLARYGELPAIYRALDGLLVDVQLVPDGSALAGTKVKALDIDQMAFLSLREAPHRGFSGWAKRSLDLVGASLALIVFSPLMLMLAGLIKISSPGPVFYRQRRTGLDGRPFAMLKFRSMEVDAERDTGPVWTCSGDQRCTPLGRFMRRWNLDELPQLFNVLAHQMSLVGPRPERAVFVHRFRQQLPTYEQRHRVHAGMTGWAQVNGWRGNTSWRRRLEFDLYYVTHWSIWLDLKILWLTLWRSFGDRNAY